MLNISLYYTQQEPCIQQCFRHMLNLREAEDMRGKELTTLGLGKLGLDIGQYGKVHDKLKVVKFMTACSYHSAGEHQIPNCT